MESIVFANSPLADYLEGLHFGFLKSLDPSPSPLSPSSELTDHNAPGNGENDISIGTHTPFVEPTDTDYSFAPPSANTFRSRFSARNLKPLRLKDPKGNYVSQISDILSVRDPF
jgi:hypothetical protein